MNQRIESHVDTLFFNVTQGENISDVKEELLANLNDKYNDLTASGKSEDEAYALVISGIGDIENLLKDLGKLPEYKPLEIEKSQEKRTVFISIGIALYVLSLMPMVLFASELGLILMLAACGAATGLIVFGNSFGKVNYTKINDSFVENYKETIVVNSNRIKLRNAVTSSMWTLIVVVYLAFSFMTHEWSWSWIIFLLGACIQQVILYVFAEPEKRKNHWHGILWTTAVILYFIISFGTWNWSWSWMIFLITAAVEQIIRMFILLKKQTDER